MINKMPNPFGSELGRISKESKRFETSDVDSLDRVAKESEKLRESDVDVVSGKKSRARLFGEKNGQGG